MRTNEQRDSRAGLAIRPSLLIGIIVVLVCLGAALAFLRRKPPTSGATTQSPASESAPLAAKSEPADESLPVQVANEPPPSAPVGKTSVVVKRNQPADTPTPPPVSRPEPSAYTRQLVNNLFNLDQGAASLPQTSEQAAAWKQNLQQLVQQGASAVPAIQEFLARNTDLGFGSDAGQMLGYSSARAAMFDALRQIGGSEAAGALVETLQATADPREINLLARNLEQMAPEQYRQDILDATRQVLAMASSGQPDQPDVAPLFDVLQKYGGPAAVSELEQSASQWKYYSAIALAQLPDGAGIPSLIKMVQDPNGGAVRNVPVLEMLVQVAAQNSDARNALLDLARANNIPPRTWAYLAPVLAGDQVQILDASSGNTPPPTTSDLRTFHIAAGNQNFYSAPIPGQTADQINQQIGLIDNLLSVTSEPTAVQALQSTRSQLVQRLPQTAAR